MNYIKILFFIIISLYFYYLKINIIKLIKLTIIIKCLFFLLGLLDISSIYINSIYFIIYISFFYNIYKNIKSKTIEGAWIKYICNIILKFIYLYLFWNLLSKIDLILAACALLEYFNIILLQAVCIPKFDYLVNGWQRTQLYLCAFGEWASATLSNSGASSVNPTTIPQSEENSTTSSLTGILTPHPLTCVERAESAPPSVSGAPAVAAEILLPKSEETVSYFPNVEDTLRTFFSRIIEASGADSFAAVASAASADGDPDPVNDLISPQNLNLSIQKFFYAISLEFSRYSSIKENDSIKWEDLLYWLKTSSILSKEEIDNLSILLKNNDYNEFFKNIPRFLKFSQNMFSDYYILNGNIYISEEDFDFYMAKQDVYLDKSKFIWVASSNKTDITNYSGNTSLTMFFDENLIPTFMESGGLVCSDKNISVLSPLMYGYEVDRLVYTGTDTNEIEGAQKYIYFMSIFDLFNNENKTLNEIEIKNKNLIKF